MLERLYCRSDERLLGVPGVLNFTHISTLNCDSLNPTRQQKEHNREASQTLGYFFFFFARDNKREGSRRLIAAFFSHEISDSRPRCPASSTQRAVASPAVFHPSRCLTGNWLRRTWLERFPSDFTEKNYSRASAKAEICPWFGLSGEMRLSGFMSIHPLRITYVFAILSGSWCRRAVFLPHCSPQAPHLCCPVRMRVRCIHLFSDTAVRHKTDRIRTT